MTIGPNRVAIASVRRHGAARPEPDQDLVTVEAPLEVLLGSAERPRARSLGILMRTPGDDRDLVLGLLHSEGIVRAAADVIEVAIASDDGVESAVVTLAPHVDLDAAAGARGLAGTSACGLCGRLEMLRLDRIATPSTPAATPIASRTIAGLPETLRRHQAVFLETGGLHAAGLFDAAGALVLLREDVGRHNAVDKVVGAALAAERLPATGCALAVSGRAAFEIVHKAAVAGVSTLVAVGAPSSLAIEAARATDLTLVGFVRDGRFNVYAGEQRITG
jgi:FdhD protein